MYVYAKKKNTDKTMTVSSQVEAIKEEHLLTSLVFIGILR